MVRQVEFTLSAYERGCHLITPLVEEALGVLPVIGLVNLFIHHTSASLTINENADPTVRRDLAMSLDSIIQEGESFYRHTSEGIDDMPAHIKATLVGASVSVPVSGGKLKLGIWQGIYLCEFRNQGGLRKITATIID